MTNLAPPQTLGRAPVFFDATGNRWRRNLTLLLAAMLMLPLGASYAA